MDLDTAVKLHIVWNAGPDHASPEHRGFLRRSGWRGRSGTRWRISGPPPP